MEIIKRFSYMKELREKIILFHKLNEYYTVIKVFYKRLVIMTNRFLNLQKIAVRYSI